MHFFLITLGILFIIGTFSILCKEHPEGMIRLAKIAGWVALVAIIITGCFALYGYNSFREYDLKKVETQKENEKLVLQAEKFVSDGGQLSDLDDTTLRSLVKAYKDIPYDLSRDGVDDVNWHVYCSFTAKKIEEVRIAKLPKSPNVWDQANKELKVLNSTSKFPEAVQTR